MVPSREIDDGPHPPTSPDSSPAAAPVTPIAVIGMACRLPGGIDSPEQLWETLLRGDDLITEIPADRWDADEYYDPESGVPGRSVSKWGSFLDDVAGFDPEFFGIEEQEATALDPQHRLLLETSWEAVEHAGLDPANLAGSRTGVYVGLTHDDYLLIAADTHALEGGYGFLGNSHSMASGRIAQAMDLRGQAISVDTACSSGLVTVHMACRSLHEGECDLALAGGVSITLDPRRYAADSAGGMLSPTGHCHAFDTAADGFASGDGCAMVLLKRLSDALSDGDRILAVIRGTAVNNGGRAASTSAPSGSAQVAAYRAALAAAGVDSETVGMVEAHGAGTPVGDPIEFASLAEVYGIRNPCAVSSTKPNLGHSQSSSGTLGLIKTVLVLRHGVVPKNLHFSGLPDELARIKTNLFVPQENTPWQSNDRQPRRAAVSAYGFSGTNAHAVLEQAPEAPDTEREDETTADQAPLLFALSSTSAGELRRTAERMADWVQAHDDIALPDLAYTLARRRGHRPVRTTVLAGNTDDLIARLRDVAHGDTSYQAAAGRDDRGPVWVFPGQGSQWPAMGAGLLATEPVFAATVAQAEPLIARESGFSVTEAMTVPEVVTGVDRVQPTLFAMQVALAATMKSYGVRPGAIIGQSLGEVAAAVVAGALSLEDGVRVICRSSRLMSSIAGSGAMALVVMPAQQVLSELMARGIKGIAMSVVASPESTVIGGPDHTVRELLDAWQARKVLARQVIADLAWHSPQVQPVLDELSEALADVTPRTPDVTFYSTSLFDPREQPICGARYWVDNLRRTVRLAAAVQAAMQDGYRVFAELAPHPLLNRALVQNARSLDMPVAALASMRRGEELPHGLRGFVKDLHSSGAAVDFSVLYPNGRLVDAPLPTWTHRRLWLDREGRESSTTHGGYAVSVHPLLGQHVRLHEEPEHHVWQGQIGTAAQPWLSDHQIRGVATLPVAAYCEMAIAAARAVLDEAFEVRDIRFGETLLLEQQTTVGAEATATSPGVFDFTVATNGRDEQLRRATAVLHTADDEQPPAHDMAALLGVHPRDQDGAEVRKRLEDRGAQDGSAFSGLGTVHTRDDATGTVLAEVALPREIRSQQDIFDVHPVLLDVCFQTVAIHPEVESLDGNAPAFPLGIRRLRAYDSARNAHYCYTRVTKVDTSRIEADLEVLDDNGAVLLAVQGLQLGTGVSEEQTKDRVLAQRLLAIEWQQRALPGLEYADPGNWLLISTTAIADVLATTLMDALKNHGAQCTTMCWPPHADHTSNSQQLRNHLLGSGFTGVVVLMAPERCDAVEQIPTAAREHVQHLMRITRELSELPGDWPRLYVVTRTAHGVLVGDAPSLEQAGLRGLVRVVGAEHQHLRATQIDLDSDIDAEQLASQLRGGSAEDETAWRDGKWYTARLVTSPLRPEERRITVVDHERDGMRLQIGTPGDLQTVELVACERIPPRPGQIEVAVSASGVNFPDALVALGRYGGAAQLGGDFAGVVTAVGPGVAGPRVGDHVGGLCPGGSWGTFVTCDARLAVPLPGGLSEEQAAGVTTAAATAWYGLHDLARIESGEKVLIHSATGGVGQAAIAIARAAGAQIFATAGSEQRRQLLRDMGIEYVYNSRSIEFADLVRRDTAGYGVDIVLNSATGAAQRAGVELLAHGGRFVDIGKGDIHGDTRIGLSSFRRNLTLYALDLEGLARSHPSRLHRLLSTVYQLTADGVLPLPRCRHYPLTEACTALELMSNARHTGKLVLDIARTGTSQVRVPPDQARVFRNNGGYIVTGRPDGVEMSLVERMAAAGCGRIVLCSRSQPTSESLARIESIRAGGADVVVECGDISEAATAERLVAAATATGLALRGVLHAAAVDEDAALTGITDELIERTWAPRVYGAWHLHEATAGHPLDWFCSFSSAASMLGAPGQSASAAADSWLDAFTRWRRAQGLPTTAIAWAPWAQSAPTTAADSAGITITPDEGAYAFEMLLRHDRAHTGYAPITATTWLTAFTHGSPFAEAFRSTSQTATGVRKLRAELDELPVDEWSIRLRRLVSDQVTQILRRNIDPDRPLSEYGMDSLGAHELCTRIETETGIRITFADLADMGTIRGLAGLLCERMAPTHDMPPSSAPGKHRKAF
ncbi:polyketide synthase [Mycobacterium sp. 852002-51163_SCH5372311]|uniref:sulfolipid-1 biosynthesis phthioceranic/hydroxyphthioceranic acid synthase n=1 Tax=Mycobacterium sp. 852002-51163_SCH5372311 TaxID=1834097 RepID=UPI00080123B8|nr:type I polyketide synthase [Mycobacterium sp. 852002-51163_SCH5372311]OBF83049.1 polyketide synthase [Mycobacterium sp. 852002-51163_SCH5372311]